ncbi:glycosyltransferase [Aliarcobacter cryaerophilus]|uniref:glycosyltransferase n=1 Tax=Aliarcobacter cryaerophilus TaxID=28198 RepID=UPI003DA44A63
MNNITFVIFTYNEEKRIERVIKNLKDYGTVLIADNQSTDRTQEIAKEYGCDIYIRTEKFEFVESQEMMDKLSPVIKTDWLYWGFADEMLDIETLDEIIKIIATNNYDIISIDRKNYYHGKFCYDAFASRTNKIFKKGAIDFSNNVIHGFGKATVKEEKIYNLPDNMFVHHFISNTVQSYLNTINRYTETELKFSHKDRGPLFHLVLQPIRTFLVHFIIKKGYKAGFAGWNLTFIQIFYYIVKYIKISEQKNKLTAVEIEKRNDVFRDVILEKFDAK